MKYPDSSLQNYWSPAQVRLYVSGVWIDDACSVSYIVSDPKYPKFGYFDRVLRAVATGQTIVNGELAINFRFNGYLRGVIEQELGRRKDFDYLSSPEAGFRTLSPNFEEVLNMSVADQLVRLSAIAQSQSKSRENEFEKYKNQWWDRKPAYPDVVRPAQNTQRRFEEAYDRPGLFTQGFDIMMVWGTDTDHPDPALTRYILDVHLVSEMVQAEIEVPDGGRVIREVYRFLAKEVRAGDPAKSVPPAGGALVGAH